MISEDTNVVCKFILAQYPAYRFNQPSFSPWKGVSYLSATNLARSGWELPVRSLIELVDMSGNLYLLTKHESETS